MTIEDEIFIGHGVTFVNGTYPRATSDGQLQTEAHWKVEATQVCRGASIGSGATVLADVAVGQRAIVDAGSAITKDVLADAIVADNPAGVLRYINPESPADQPSHHAKRA